MDESIFLTALFLIFTLIALITYEYTKDKTDENKKIPFK